MTETDPIIPRETLETLLDATRLREEAIEMMAIAEEEARRLVAEARTEGRAKGIAEGSAAAARLIADARREAAARASALEDTLAGLVADTVRTILGDGDREAMVRAATRTALLRLGTDPGARLHVAPDMAAAVQAALDDIEADLPLLIDESLPAGTTLLSGAEGHAHIGLDQQVDAALAAFEGR